MPLHRVQNRERNNRFEKSRFPLPLYYFGPGFGENFDCLCESYIWDIAYRFAIKTDNLEVYADPLFEKVFFNLFDNAVRHGEHVTEIWIRFEQRGYAGVLIVEDDGVGVTKEDKSKIFRRGFGKYTGFGLFLTREILAITGITIQETGEPGKGARFEMIVPTGEYRFAT